MQGDESTIQMCPLGPDNVGLRGTKLQNTEYAFGCAVYTGSDTKMSQNSQLKANKFSSIEVAMNKYLLVYILFLVVEIVLSTSLRYTVGVEYAAADSPPWYLTNVQGPADKPAKGKADQYCVMLFNLDSAIYNYIPIQDE